MGVVAQRIVPGIDVPAQGLAQLVVLPRLWAAFEHAVLQAGANTLQMLGDPAQAFGVGPIE